MNMLKKFKARKMMGIFFSLFLLFETSFSFAMASTMMENEASSSELQILKEKLSKKDCQSIKAKISHKYKHDHKKKHHHKEKHMKKKKFSKIHMLCMMEENVQNIKNGSLGSLNPYPSSTLWYVTAASVIEFFPLSLSRIYEEDRMIREFGLIQDIDHPPNLKFSFQTI